MTPSSPDPAEALVFAHRPAMLRLAQSLLGGDLGAAEDIVQDAFAVAVSTDRVDPHQDGGWLTGVVRNLARSLRRQQARRRRHEDAIERMAADETTPEAIQASLEVQRQVVDAFSALSEPYRSTLFLRYYKDQTPTEIAAAQGVPLATVKSRLQRGLGQLRASLDARHGGDRRAWCVALAVFASPRPTRVVAGALAGGAGVLGSLTMMKIAVSIAAVMLVLFLATSSFWIGGATESPTVRDPIAAQQVDDGPNSPARDEAPRTGPAALERTALAEPAVATVRGRVLDCEANGLPGIQVRFPGRGPSGTLVTAADGSFELPRPTARGGFGVMQPGWHTVVSAVFDPQHPEREMLLVLARTARWAGRVRTPDGTPVPHARLDLPQLAAAVSASVGMSLDAATTNTFLAETDAQGNFEVLAAPIVPGLKLHVGAGPRFGRAELSAPSGVATQMDIVLDAKSSELVAIGRVFLPDGRPAGPGIQVMFGRACTRTGTDGGYRLVAREPRHRPRKGDRLVAVAPRHQPVEREADWLADPSNWPARIDLVLPGPARTLRGRVVDADDAPVPGATVWIEDMTPAGFFEDVAVFVEALSHGAPYGVDSVQTAADGSFQLPGLMERSYTIGLLDTRSLQVSHHDGVTADAGEVVLRTPALDQSRRIAGRIVSQRGLPVAGVRVLLNTTYRKVFVPGDPTAASTRSVSGNEQFTDGDGRFEIAGVPEGIENLRVEADTVMPTRWPLPTDAPLVDLEVRVSLRRNVQLVLLPGSKFAQAAKAELHDGAGRPLKLMAFTARSSRSSRHARFLEGKTPVLAVAETAAHIVLYDTDGKELHRQPLGSAFDEAAPGDTATVRLEIR